MKRIIMLAALLLVASGCATRAQTQANKAATPSQNTNSAATANTAPAPTTTAATTSDDDAIAREKQIWEMLKKKDYDGFSSMLADDQVEVSPGGVYDKATTLKGVRDADLSTVTLSDFKVLKLDDDAVVVTYVVKTTAVGANPGGYRESTVWVNRGGKWLAAFHQGTPVAAPSPQPE